MTMPRLFLGLVGAALVWGGTRSHPPADPFAPDPRSCQPCHQQIVATFIQTAHFHTSAEATAQSIKARFSQGHNVLRTRASGIYFKMERRNGGWYETGIDSAHGRSRTEQIDLVIGSGRRGQTYLYWRSALLFQLPVSYLTGPKRWINSPGYPDGQIDFGRVIVPQCLDCHSTSFTLNADRRAARYSRDYRLGISCEKCHGDGREHVRYQSSHPAETSGKYILNPAHFSTDRRVDNCALCHSGERDPRKPPFSYRPGAMLDDYLAPPSAGKAPVPDVHGNQVGLLQSSKCFRSSPDMSCSTCHDVHRPERDLAWFTQKCLGCHETRQHAMADQLGERVVTSCIDCHMPNRKSKAIEINTPTTRFALYYRSHAIGVYPEVAAAVLHSTKERQDR
jgi:hypothetical protein